MDDFRLSTEEMADLIENTNSVSRPIALKIVNSFLEAYGHNDIQGKTIDVTLPSGAVVTIPKLFYVARTVENYDHPRFMEAVGKVAGIRYPKYDVDSYLLIDLLGVNGLFWNVKYDYQRPPRHVLSTDGHVIPLPRDIDYSSRVLNDSEGLFDNTPLPVPFNQHEILECFSDCLYRGTCVVYQLRLLDFLGCHDIIGDMKDVNLFVEEWKKVLTFVPCFEQHLSGFILNDGVLTRTVKDEDGCDEVTKIWKEDDGFHFESDGYIKDDILDAAKEIGTIAEIQTRQWDNGYIQCSRRVVLNRITAASITTRMDGSIFDRSRVLEMLYKLGFNVTLGEKYQGIFERTDTPNQLRFFNFFKKDSEERCNFIVEPCGDRDFMWNVTPQNTDRSLEPPK